MKINNCTIHIFLFANIHSLDYKLNLLKAIKKYLTYIVFFVSTTPATFIQWEYAKRISLFFSIQNYPTTLTKAHHYMVHWFQHNSLELDPLLTVAP